MNETIAYVISAPHFWETMFSIPVVTAWVGNIIYNGDVKQAQKSLILIGTYVSFLLATTSTRVNNTVRINPGSLTVMSNAGIVTIGFVTLFFVVGIILGVLVTQYARKMAKNEKSSRTKSTGLSS